MNDLMEYEVEGNHIPVSKKKKKKYPLYLTDALLEDPVLGDWLRADPFLRTVAHCKFCQCKIRTCSKSYLMHHNSSPKHMKNRAKHSEEEMDIVVANDIVEMSIIKSGVDSLDNSKDFDSKESNSNSLITKVDGKKWYRQKFSQKWLKMPEFRDWLRPHPNDELLAVCIVCDMVMKHFNKSSLMKHRVTPKHTKFFKVKREAGEINSSLSYVESLTRTKRSDSDDDYHPGMDDTHYDSDADSLQGQSKNFDIIVNNPSHYAETVIGGTHKKEHRRSKKMQGTPKGNTERVGDAELILSQFIDESGMPHHQADQLVYVLKRMFPLYEDVQRLSFDRMKSSYLLHDAIAWDDEGLVPNICREKVFSLIIDECSTAHGSYVLPIMARFFNEQKCKITEGPLGVISVENSTSERLYKAIVNVLNENRIPFENMIGFASDGFCEVDKGVQMFVKRNHPSIFFLGCISHSFLMCCSQACLTLPSWLESMVKDIVGYFTLSRKKQLEFQSIQEIVDNRQYKTLKLSESSWLARSLVITKLLAMWDQLQLFFQIESELEDDEASHIYETMLNRGTKHMLLFLNYINQKIEKMDQEFQSEYFKLDTLFSTISEEYRGLLSLFMADEIVDSVCLASIDPTDESLHKRLENINLGGRCKVMLVKEPLGEHERKFRTDCLAFLVDLCVQIRNKFSFKTNSVLSLLKVLDPGQALSPKRNSDAVIELAAHFPNLVSEEDLDSLQDQWMEIPKIESLSKNCGKASIFWYELGKFESDNKAPKFELLSRFMCSLLALPQSSSFVEQVFSQVNYVA